MYCPYCKSQYKADVTECPYCETQLVQFPLLEDTKSPSHPSEYLNDLEEWNRNQYNPGYWTGGNIPPHIKALSKVDGRKRGAGALICGIFLYAIIASAWMEIDFQNTEDLSTELLSVIPVSLAEAFIGALLVWSGFKRLEWFNIRK